MLKYVKEAALVAALSLPVSATAATFDFTGFSDGITEELTDTVAGITVTVTAGSYLFDGLFFNPDQDGVFGLDVPDLAVATRDDCAINGFFGCFIPQDAGIGVALADVNFLGDVNATEMLTFTFSQLVSFNSIEFGNVDDDDDFDIFVDGVFVAPGENGIAGNNPFAFSGLRGTSISIGADALFDDFNIRSLEVSAVPLPAAGWMLIAGMGGLAVAKRRRKA
ncbi:MAG: VPLPA-CTERM sorting domain-containing protein [Pseudomonadota bacterium]